MSRSKNTLSPPARKENLIVSMVSLPMIDSVLNVGPGDSGLLALSLINCERLSPPAVREAPQISQAVRDGWFSKVHLEQIRLPLLFGVRGDNVAS